MTLFLIAIFLIYGSAHVYVFRRITAAFPLRSAVGKTALIVLMISMMLAPILVRMSERYGYESTACLLSYVGYLWMGVLFLFFVLSVLIDLYRLLIHSVGRIVRKDLSPWIPSARYLFVIPLILSTALNAYGFFEAKTIRTEWISIRTEKIPKEIGRLRIVHVSDIHIGLIVRGQRLDNILAAVRRAQPDILVSTGDLLDGQIDNISAAADLLRDIRPRYGKFAVMGNHEFFAGADAALAFHRQAGFTVLRGQSSLQAGLIGLAGVDDITGKRFDQYEGGPEKDLLATLPESVFRLLLKHRPDIDSSSLGHFDLQLSGHTHRGQIYPFVLFTRLAFPYHSGYYSFPGGSRLYVSRGAGTWGPPVRVLAPPEVTVIDLINPN